MAEFPNELWIDANRLILALMPVVSTALAFLGKWRSASYILLLAILYEVR